MRRSLLSVIASSCLVAGIFAIQAASAACEGSGADDDARCDGNEIAGGYFGDIPVETEVAGEGLRTDEAWIEVQDDGEETPVAVEWGWKGRNPVFFGVEGCSDGSIQYIEDELEP